MKRIFFPLCLILAVFISCRSIRPDKPSFTGISAPLPSALSQINFPIIIPLTFLEDNLNQDWSNKLLSEQGMTLGNGLSTDIDVTRIGKINLAGETNNRIKARVPMNLKGELKIEKNLFGQVLSTTFPFDENLQPEITFRPVIGRDWDLSIQDLEIANWGKSLTYNLMGFQIDLDPIIRKHVQQVLRNQLTASNLSNMDFKEMAQQAWDSFGKTFTVDQNDVTAYIYSIPRSLKIKEQVTTDGKLILYIGIDGNIYSQIGKAPEVLPSELPNIELNQDSTNRLDIILPLAIRYVDLDHYLNTAVTGQQLKMDNNTTLIPSNLKTQNFGDKALLQLDFMAIRNSKKDISGQFYLVGKPIYDPESESIRFVDIEFDISTKNLLARSRIRSKQNQILSHIRKMAVYPIGEYLQKARQEIQHKGYFDTEFATFQTINPGLDVQGIYLTEEDIRIYLKSSGQLDVRLKGFSERKNLGF